MLALKLIHGSKSGPWSGVVRGSGKLLEGLESIEYLKATTDILPISILHLHWQLTP